LGKIFEKYFMSAEPAHISPSPELPIPPPREPLMAHILGALGFMFLSLLNLTLRWERNQNALIPDLWSDGVPKIIALWHDRQLMMSWLVLKQPRTKPLQAAYALISAHRDGRFMACALSWFGFRSVTGSSSKGGKEGLRGLVRVVNQQGIAVITPDGPRGPRHECKAGVIELARLTGAPIYPAAYSAKNRWCFKSWDKMFLPKPFSPAVFILGDPIYVPSEVTEEQFDQHRMNLEKNLRAVTSEADLLMGVQ
jgi:lysophospholipid acyltransferase (LPLAT)-like uncharacterized protein